LIQTYIKNQLVFWSNDKKQLSESDVITCNSLNIKIIIKKKNSSVVGLASPHYRLYFELFDHVVIEVHVQP